MEWSGGVPDHAVLLFEAVWSGTPERSGTARPRWQARFYRACQSDCDGTGGGATVRAVCGLCPVDVRAKTAGIRLAGHAVRRVPLLGQANWRTLEVGHFWSHMLVTDVHHPFQGLTAMCRR